MKTFTVTRFKVSLLASAIALGGFAAQAQAQSRSPAGPPAAEGVSGDIIVTARKRVERLQDVPAPVSVIPASELLKSGATSFTDYVTKVPGVNVTSSVRGNAVLIFRGITTGSVNSSVATYVDEIPFGSSTVFTGASGLTPDLDPAIISQIELLRGPQGTTYGANAIGGLLKFTTVKPNSHEFSGRVEAGVETIDHGGTGWSVRGLVNIPVVDDRLAVTASGYYRNEPGYLRNATLNLNNVNAARVYGGRADLMWTPVDALSVRLSATFHESHADNYSNVDVTQVPINANNGRLTGFTSGDRTTSDLVPRQPFDLRYRIYNGTLNWDLGGATIVSSTSYQTQRVVTSGDITAAYAPTVIFVGSALTGGSPYPANLGLGLERSLRQNKLTQEVRLSSSGKRTIDWQIGAFYTRERSTQETPINAYTLPTGAPFVVAAPYAIFNDIFRANQISRYSEISVFGNVDYHVTSKFDVLVGLRYSHDQQRYQQPTGGLLYRVSAIFAGDSTALAAFLAGATDTGGGSSKESAVTFLVNPSWKLDADNLLYARIASGYRPGGPNQLAPVPNFPASFGPDHLYSYELGWKSSFMGGKISLDASIYYINWADIQLATVVNNFAAQGNGGAASARGVEASLIFRPLVGLTFGGNLTYNDAHINHTDTPTLTCAFPGDQLPYSARWTWNLNAEYSWLLGGGWSAYAGADYRNFGSRAGGLVVNPSSTTGGYYVRLPAYDQVDLRAGIAKDQWTLGLYVKNASDTRGLTAAGAKNGVPQSAAYAAALTQPRTFGMRISRRF